MDAVELRQDFKAKDELMSNTSGRGFRLTLERLKESGIVLANLANLTYTNSLVLQNDAYLTSKMCALWIQNTSSGEIGFTAGTIHLYGR